MVLALVGCVSAADARGRVRPWAHPPRKDARGFDNQRTWWASKSGSAWPVDRLSRCGGFGNLADFPTRALLAVSLAGGAYRCEPQALAAQRETVGLNPGAKGSGSNQHEVRVQRGPTPPTLADLGPNRTQVEKPTLADAGTDKHLAGGAYRCPRVTSSHHACAMRAASASVSQTRPNCGSSSMSRRTTNPRASGSTTHDNRRPSSTQVQTGSGP